MIPHRLLGLGLWLSTPKDLRASFWRTDFLTLGRACILAWNNQGVSLPFSRPRDPQYTKLEADLADARRVKQQQDEAEILARLEKPSSRRIIT